MTQIANTACARLEAEGRMLNPVLKAPTRKSSRFGFRGELALKFAAKLADEARPPELSADQVMAVAEEGTPAIPFFAAYLHSFEYLKALAEVLSGLLSPSGKYFLFCNNIDLLATYRVPYDGITFFVLPIDEAGVYGELLELLRLEKNTLKKLDTASKLDTVADKAMQFEASFPEIAYKEGLTLMGPVRDAGANRPV